jgi:hypothetical protein
MPRHSRPQTTAQLTPPGQLPPKLRKTLTWLEPQHIAKLEQEVMRRKAVGENVDGEGVRINVNRSLIIRELIDRADFPL